MHRFLFVAVLVGSQLATGCCSYGPYLPRLHSGWGCGAGTCGTPILNRPVLNRPILRPLAVEPIYSAGSAIGTPLGYAPPAAAPYPTDGYGPVGGYPVSGPGCVGCGSGPGLTVSAGYPGGPADGPLATVAPESAGYPTPPYGLPIGDGPGNPYGGYPGVPISGPPGTPAPMPMVMPSAMLGGVPHDSALLKMPTIMPPGPKSESKRPPELARKMSPAK